MSSDVPTIAYNTYVEDEEANHKVPMTFEEFMKSKIRWKYFQEAEDILEGGY